MISILLPAYKSSALLGQIFLPSFLNNSRESVELIMYDNGGNGDIQQGDHSFYYHNLDVKVIGNGENIGLNAALNECIKVAKGDYFYLPHTDMHLLPGWDTALLNAAKNQPKHKFLMCSRSIEKNSHIPTQLLKDFGTDIASFEEKELYEFHKNYEDNGIVTSYRMPFFIHRSLADKMTEFNIKYDISQGPFDESLFSYATDNDLFFTAYEVGARSFWMVNSSVIYHLSGQSNNKQSVDKDSNKPYEYLLDKWRSFGYDIDMNIDASEQRLIPWGIKVK